MDKAKVSDGLCDAIGIIHGYVPKRYWGNGEQACRDAIVLLKERDVAEPIIIDHIVFGTNRKCSKCNRYLFPAGRYCPHCGRSLRWEDD